MVSFTLKNAGFTVVEARDGQGGRRHGLDRQTLHAGANRRRGSQGSRMIGTPENGAQARK